MIGVLVPVVPYLAEAETQGTEPNLVLWAEAPSANLFVGEPLEAAPRVERVSFDHIRSSFRLV